MIRAEVDAAVDGTTEDVERLFVEMAWCRTRNSLGITGAPYSVYEDTVTAEMRSEMQRQLRGLAETLGRVEADWAGRRGTGA